MKSLSTRLWHSSPASLSQAIRRRVQKLQHKPSWHTIKGGPLKGAEFYIPGQLLGGWAEMAEGTFDLFFYDELRKRDVKDWVCWDIGAHIGYHSLGFAALGMRVVCFEPNPANIKLLRIQFEKNPNLSSRIRHVATAVGDQDGEMSFILTDNVASGESSGSHLEAASESSTYSAGFYKITVPVTRIDTLIERGEPVPQILKIDVEGAEALVLKGGEKLFSNQKPLVLMEVHHIRLAFEVQEFLQRNGYRVTVMDDKNSTASRCFIMASSKT